MTAYQCRAMVEGPKVGYRVVLWRRQCRNLTTDPSGYCHVHRPRAR